MRQNTVVFATEYGTHEIYDTNRNSFSKIYAEPFVTKARIGVPLMIKSCFLTVSAFLITNFVPEVKL